MKLSDFVMDTFFGQRFTLPAPMDAGMTNEACAKRKLYEISGSYARNAWEIHILSVEQHGINPKTFLDGAVRTPSGLSIFSNAGMEIFCLKAADAMTSPEARLSALQALNRLKARFDREQTPQAVVA